MNPESLQKIGKVLGIILMCSVGALVLLVAGMVFLGRGVMFGGAPILGWGQDSSSAVVSSPVPELGRVPLKRGMMGSESADALGMMVADEGSAVPFTDTSAVIATERKEMKNGNLDVRVRNLDEAVVTLRRITTDFGGHIVSLRLNNESAERRSGVVSLRVPAARFDEAFDALRGVAQFVESAAVSSQDVTAEHIDLEARLRNKRAEESALQMLLTQVTKMSDIIELTGKLASVRSHIESLEGQMRSLAAQTEYSLITVVLHEDTTVVVVEPGLRPLETIKQALQTLLSLAGKMVLGVAVFAIVAVPILLVFGLVLFGCGVLVYRVVRRVVR